MHRHNQICFAIIGGQGFCLAGKANKVGELETVGGKIVGERMFGAVTVLKLRKTFFFISGAFLYLPQLKKCPRSIPMWILLARLEEKTGGDNLHSLTTSTECC